MLLLFSLLVALAASVAGIQGSSENILYSNLPGTSEGLPGIHASFDYVVVGGGTAGVTIAARLAENKFRVALIEAGDFYEVKYPISKIPGACSLGVGSDPKSTLPVDWKFVAKSVPGANYRDIHYPRGKCLGGSSALNFMIYQRPTVDSMQLWADLIHDQSYTFDKVLPYFKKTVHFTSPRDKLRFANATARFNENAFDNNGQPLQVSYPNYAMSFSSWVKQGLETIGIKETQDFNSGSLIGSQYCAFTIRPSDERRSSSEAAFFRTFSSIKRLKTLRVYKNTLAKRILFDSRKRATGVEVKTGFLKYALNAKREVIVSAGAFQSPQLLMVSGIGPVDVLEEHGIKVISNLPGVGQNMWDHPFFGPTYQVALETYTKMATDTVYLARQLSKYATFHKGPLTNPVADYLAFEKIPKDFRSGFSPQMENDLSWFPGDWPEVEYLSAAVYVGNFSNPFAIQPKGGGQYATILGTLVAPTSRGNVTITSADTADLPVINPNWLSTETDQQVAIATYKRIRDAFHSDSMAPIIVGDEYFPGSKYKTDVEILEVIRNSVMTIFHAACTCKMGISSDNMAVLDSKARVFGVGKLRVVDASAFPILTPGHPQSTVYMLAEKIASNIVNNSD
ncbi:hypothetical protein ASPWEDRAFT_747480 [Aspergillus wentii DTO 134E9]|uniref:Glucose-methanol-choline oxidoreductase N-terminal domain-containing protein n=1 Tax=Aspergillus wentii DTO 134E9 TaxID=1073089 RepID=A0A1L9R998_ASPWE|nr:uncharacterized protein ASPWEDRAFT_747480 [Aspergillus wentii DTO 134E9]OJJ31501.1 hypothetical protein ASPWEDRAFT_747480 [Aspergillus wentii DTO 134E9]